MSLSANGMHCSWLRALQLAGVGTQGANHPRVLTLTADANTPPNNRPRGWKILTRLPFTKITAPPPFTLTYLSRCGRGNGTSENAWYDNFGNKRTRILSPQHNTFRHWPTIVGQVSCRRSTTTHVTDVCKNFERNNILILLGSANNNRRLRA